MPYRLLYEICLIFARTSIGWKLCSRQDKDFCVTFPCTCTCFTWPLAQKAGQLFPLKNCRFVNQDCRQTALRLQPVPFLRATNGVRIQHCECHTLPYRLKSFPVCVAGVAVATAGLDAPIHTLEVSRIWRMRALKLPRIKGLLFVRLPKQTVHQAQRARLLP